MRLNRARFSELYVYLKGKPIRFSGRPYLPTIYTVNRNLVIRASRQVEKSTLLVNTILYEAFMNPGIQILFVCPRQEQARVFSHSRLLPCLEQSPLLRRVLLGRSRRKLPVMNIQFHNDSQLYIRAAFRSADAARGISADLLLIDEFQDIAGGNLPVLQETMSHATNARTIITGTPKLIDNHLDAIFSQSTAHEWKIPCLECRQGVILDERCMGPTCIVCPGCQHPLDPTTGTWIARNPTATWGDGFWINHLMVPWLNYDEVYDRRRVYDLAQFKNEVLGLPTAMDEHVVTRAELEACCGERPMSESAADFALAGRVQLVAGIDWGGGGTARTVVTVGFMRTDYVFEVIHFSRFRPDEDPTHVLRSVAQVCERFQISWIAADGGGNGHVYNRLLLDELRANHLYAILYSSVDQAPCQDGLLWKWTVNRSATIGVLFTRIKKGQLRFPRLEDCGTYLDEFACEVAEYDDLNRTVRYTHPQTQPDDSLHATNYALLMGVRIHNAAS